MTTLTEEQIRTIAAFWRMAIESGRFQMFDPAKPLVPSDAYGATAEALATGFRSKIGLSPVKLDAFETELRRRLTERPSEGFCLTTDYQPCGLLADAAKAIALPEILVFPWKSMSRVEDGKVYGRIGYGAPEYLVTLDAQGKALGVAVDAKAS